MYGHIKPPTGVLVRFANIFIMPWTWECFKIDRLDCNTYARLKQNENCAVASAGATSLSANRFSEDFIKYAVYVKCKCHCKCLVDDFSSVAGRLGQAISCAGGYPIPSICI